METLIEKYVESKKWAWAETSLKTEKHRLHGLAEILDTGDADALYLSLRERLKPYSLLTTWTRVITFYDWLIQQGERNGPNQYRTFKEDNQKAFKYAYQPKLPTLSFEEAKSRVEGITDPATREKALQLLLGGLRYTESQSVRDGQVVGKGSKPRRVFVGECVYGRSYRTFLRKLKSVGLTPHTLRKLAATRLAKEGLREADLCQVMGWSSFETAKVYLAPMREEELQGVFNKMKEGSKND